MPAKGQVSDGFAAGSTAPQRELAAVMQKLCGCILDDCVKESQAEISRLLHIDPATLSGYLHARRTPASSRILDRLYDLAEKSVAEAGGASMPASRADLMHAYEQARVRHCDCCRIGYPPERGRLTARQRPAGRNFQRLLRGSLPAEREARRRLPVPLLVGDRQPNSRPYPTWAPLEELARYLREGREGDARVLLEYAGGVLPVDEVPSVVTVCREAGLDQAADTVLHHAGQREKGAVLRLTRQLLSEQRYEDADLLLHAGIADSA